MKKLLTIPLTLLLALLLQTGWAESSKVPNIAGTWTATYKLVTDKSLEQAKGKIEKAIRHMTARYVIRQSGEFFTLTNLSAQLKSKDKILHTPTQGYHYTGRGANLKIGVFSPIQDATIYVVDNDEHKLMIGKIIDENKIKFILLEMNKPNAMIATSVFTRKK